jgi:predicted phosphodiesterase
MRYAFISDIHSNIEAFESVLADMEREKPDRILFLGDIVGYGPNPNECIDKLLQVADVSLGGNHDWAVVGKTPDDYFNPFAKAAVDWTGKALREDSKDFLLRTKASGSFDGFQVAHATPFNPEEWRYIMSHKEALENYSSIEDKLCFIGHSHQPMIIEYRDPATVKVYREQKFQFRPENKYIVNVGSVGQPRDTNVKACWGLYDSDENTFEYHRVAYDIASVQKKMEAVGLPRYLIERLAQGR